MHSGLREGELHAPSKPITWDWILSQLMLEIPQIVEDFLNEYREQYQYPDDQVSQEDIVDTAYETFELLIRRLRGEPDSPSAAGRVERLAARRVQQGIPLALFLQAVRLDFRILWLHAQRIAGAEGSTVLASNVIVLLTIVDQYIDALRDAYSEEEGRIDRTQAAQRHRMTFHLFSGNQLRQDEIELISQRLNMRADAKYEVVVVTGDAISAMNVRYGNDRTVGMFESVNHLVLFREQTARDQWLKDSPGFGGYVGEVTGLGEVPAAAKVALKIAQHAPTQSVALATEDEVWATVARSHLAQAFPRFTTSISAALAELPSHESERLVDAVLIYIRTGSIKATATELYCHRNTVINRLRSFFEITGYNPTLPKDAAWIYVALSAESSS